jgi:hypothetical protein
LVQFSGEIIDMNTKLFAASACLAWGAALFGSTAPADAYAITSQSGSYATCSANYSPASHVASWCSDEYGSTDPYGTQSTILYTNYEQQIKLVATSCNSGPCSSGNDLVYTDFIYNTGRKVVSSSTVLCGGNTWRYEIGTCAC